MFYSRKQPVCIWLPSMSSQWDKKCEFPGDAYSPLYCDEALWRLAPLKDMYSHALQDDPSDWVQDSDGAEDQMLRWLRASRPLLCPAWVFCTTYTSAEIIEEQKLLCLFLYVFAEVFIKCDDIASDRQVIIMTFQRVVLCARHQMEAQKLQSSKYLLAAANIWPVTCYFLWMKL